MNARRIKSKKSEKVGPVNIETLIERIKKARALNCDPYDVGIDAAVWKMISWNRAATFGRS